MDWIVELVDGEVRSWHTADVLAHARATLAAWQADYNTVRPHGAIGNLPPAIYATLSAPGMQRDGTPRGAPEHARRPVPLHHRA